MWTKNNTLENLIDGVIKHGPDILEHCQTSADLSQYLNRITAEHLHYPTPNHADPSNWFIPKEYQQMDIIEWVMINCPKENLERTAKELELFQKHNMIPVLKTMKYIVDTLRTNNLVWGVGRGSSVASYVLHLIGVHKIDSIKYNLPIEEFFKGE